MSPSSGVKRESSLTKFRLPVSMKKVFVGLACVVVMGGIGYLLLVHLLLSPTCDLTKLESLPSPDGRFIASAFRKDCGATTDYVTGVALHPAGEPFDDDNSDVVLTLTGIVPISQIWVTDDELHLKLPPTAPIFRQVDRWNKIKVMIVQ